MSRDHTRVHQRFLDRTGSPQLRPDDAVPLPTRLVFTPEARQAIVTQLYATGHLRGGCLFGYITKSDAIIVAAPSNGYRLLDPLLATDPLRHDERYLLGWSDALNHTSPVEIDWLGCWVMWPNSMVGPMEDEYAWLRRGRETDLFNLSRYLCTFGWYDGKVYAHAYGSDPVTEDIRVLSTNL